ncbi:MULTISPECIES: hypothetical protein [Rhodococcus]|uniref:hypothetical protein n=1 Tax=Rhodococcus TaxID=1827 RepID=UPI000C7A63DD|nr:MULTISPECIES: hypothetical protein [Rhodococcus]AUM17203.1 hypothetical protein CSW53_12145 [Rhodococcus ruber]
MTRTSTPNHTATDALAYAATLVRTQIEWLTDAILDRLDTDAAAEVEPFLDQLDALARQVGEIARQHDPGGRYSDGRPIESRLNIDGYGQIVQLWPADPTHARPQRFEIRTRTGVVAVTLTPPGTVTAEPVRALAVVRTASEGTLR